MLLVIFGAGASFDSVPQIPVGSGDGDRPPLANQLFDDRAEFVSVMENYSNFLPLIPILRKPNVVVEQELARFQEESRTYPARTQQLFAIRYYLQVALWNCQARWAKRHHGTTNLATLLDRIEKWRFETKQDVCLVTFNYDNMLERAISQVLGVKFDDISKYITQPNYVLVKLHGSVDWGRTIAECPSSMEPNARSIIEHASHPLLRLGDQYTLASVPAVRSRGGALLIPAVAIPVEKKDEFVCPQEHIRALDNALPSVTKVMTIGWRATEQEFLTKLQSVTKENLRLMIVSGDESGAKETLNNLRNTTPMPEPTLVTVGFTGLIHNIEWLDAFLRS